MADEDGGAPAVPPSEPVTSSAPPPVDTEMSLDTESRTDGPVSEPQTTENSAAGEKRRRSDAEIESEGDVAEAKRPRADADADTSDPTSQQASSAVTATETIAPTDSRNSPTVSATGDSNTAVDTTENSTVKSENPVQTPAPVAAPEPTTTESSGGPSIAPMTPASVGTPASVPAPVPAPTPDSVATNGHATPATGASGRRTTNQLHWMSTRLMKQLYNHKQSWPFRVPVDPVALKLPTYFDVIKNPMDLSTVKKKLKEREYTSGSEAIADLRLIWNNCRTFNRPGDDVCQMADILENYMDEKLKGLPTPEEELAPASKKTKRNVIAGLGDPNLTTPTSTGGIVAGRRSSSRPVRPPMKDIAEEQLMTLPTSAPKKPSKKMTARMKFCHQLIKELMHKKHLKYSWPFLKPVDAQGLGLTDYYDIIKTPMDLGTVRQKLDGGKYEDADDFLADIDLVFENCYKYNPKDHDVVQLAKDLHHVYVMKKSAMPARDAEEEKLIAEENARVDAWVEPQPVSVAPIVPPAPTPPLQTKTPGRSKSSGKAAGKSSSKTKNSRASAPSSVAEDDASEESSSSSEESEDSSSSDGMDGEQAQLMYMKAMIAKMESKMKKKKKKKTKKKKSTKVKKTPGTKSSKSKATAGKSKASKTPKATQQKKKKPVAKKKSQAGSAATTSGKKKARKADSSDSDSSDSSEEEAEEEMTWDQKRELSQDVNALSEQHLHEVIAIIKRKEKGVSSQSDEMIEIDFNELENGTLRALQDYVAATKKAQKKKKKSAAMTTEEQEANLQRRLANIESQLATSESSQQPYAPADDESSRAGGGRRKSVERDSDFVAPPPVPQKKTTSTSRPSKRPQGPPASLLVQEVQSSAEAISFEAATRVDSGGTVVGDAGTDVEILQATTAAPVDEIQVENASAWLSFGDGSSMADVNGGGGPAVDADVSDFSKFQRLNEEKRVRDQTDAEVAARLESERLEAENIRRKQAEIERAEQEKLLAEKAKHREEEEEKRRAEEVAERQRLREEAKREREAMTGHMDLHQQSTVMAAFDDDGDGDDDLDGLLE